MLKNKGIAFKLILLIGICGALILLAILGVNYSFTSKIVHNNLKDNAKNLALSTVHQIEAVLNPIEKVPESLAQFLQRSDYDEQTLLENLKAIVVNNPEIYGAAIAFEPYAFRNDSLYYSPYYCKEGDTVRLTYIGGENYQYFYWDWYQIPKSLNKPIWTEPYYDEGAGEIIMSTYSVPFYKSTDGEKKLMGIVTSDISMSWLQAIVDSIKIYETGYGFLISRNGTVITHRNSSLIMNETIFSLAETLRDSTLRDIGQGMIRGESDYVPISSLTDGRKSWIYYVPLPSSGWSLGVLFPEDELMSDIALLSKILLAVGIIGFVLLIITVILIATGITRPLRTLVSATEEVAAGNFDLVIPAPKTGGEVGKLTESFSSMTVSLKDYIEKLTETTTAKERIESELQIAHDIQMSIIPRMFPPFPEMEEFDIFADIKPAKEVGGDYYDFFFIDDDHLCFTIGDVSGKGVPASLFMAVTRTLIRAKTIRGLSPAQVMCRVNEDLCLNNESGMFVTIFLGFFNIRTGEIQYCNGGHDAPFIVHPNGKVEPMGEPDGLLVGVIENFDYITNKFKLEADDALILFTDGVHEAMDVNDNLFSIERLVELLERMNDTDPEKMTKTVFHAVQEYEKGAVQSDDVTILSLKYYGDGGKV